MRFQHVQQSRPDWYDRNPVARVSQYDAGALAPSALTTRWTYTVPASKKYMVQLLVCSAIRYVPAGTCDQSGFLIYYTPAGGSPYLVCQAYLTGNVQQDQNQVVAGSGLVLLAGDVLVGKSFNVDTGGSIVVLGVQQGLEFDA